MGEARKEAMCKMDDTKIIELFFQRDQQAIRELDAKYGKVCHSLSFNIVNNRQDAEECVNDSYLGVWNAIPPARPNPLLSFVLKIVRNLSVNTYWKNKAEKRNSDYTVAMQEVESFLAAPNSTEDAVEAKELARMIEDFLDTQTVEDRVIFMRRYWFSDSHRDIAKAVGLSEKNVSVRLTRLRKKLRDYIQREVLV